MLGTNQNIVYSRNISKQGQVYWKKRKVVKNDKTNEYILKDLQTSHFERKYGFSHEFGKHYDILPKETDI
tara:strand:- start:619 stop:828 length:210 start_codon:yes stop_codon:yes gene_type:complete